MSGPDTADTPDPPLPGYPEQTATGSFAGCARFDGVDAPQPPLPPPDAFPGYEILRALSHGGQGVVYQAIQQATRQKVAIKVLLEGPYASPAARRRFEREIELAAQLKHPHIVSVFDAGTTPDERQFYVMEYVRGTPLNAYVREKKLSLEEALRLFAKVCDAVQYAHQRGIIHRDLKPTNILVDAPGEPKILDFGLAKWLAAPAEELATISQQVLGTLPYMSPEQTRGNPDEIDTRTDIYALGVILYEMLTGGYPYPVAGQVAQVLRHIAEEEPTPPSRRWNQDSGIAHRSSGRVRAGRCPIDDEVQTIVLKSLSKERERRYQSAGELARDIEHYLAGEPIEARRDSALYVLKKQLRRYRLPVVVAALFTLSVTVGFATSVTFWRRAEAEKGVAEVAAQNELRQHKVADEQTAEANLQRDRAREAEQQANEERLRAQEKAREAERSRDEADLARTQAIAEQRTAEDAVQQAQAEAGARVEKEREAFAARDAEAKERQNAEKAREQAESERDKSQRLAADLEASNAELDAARQRAVAERDAARTEASRQLDIRDVLIDLVGRLDPDVYAGHRRFAELLERALADQTREQLDPGVAAALHGILVGAYGSEYVYNPARAADHAEQAAEIAHSQLGEQHAETARALGNLADIRSLQGRSVDAERLAAQARALGARTLAVNDPRLLVAKLGLGTGHNALPISATEAEGSDYRTALEQWTRQHGTYEGLACYLLFLHCVANHDTDNDYGVFVRSVRNACRDTLGEEHPQTLLLNCGVAFCILDEYRCAQKLEWGELLGGSLPPELRREFDDLTRTTFERAQRRLGWSHPITSLAYLSRGVALWLDKRSIELGAWFAQIPADLPDQLCRGDGQWNILATAALGFGFSGLELLRRNDEDFAKVSGLGLIKKAHTYARRAIQAADARGPAWSSHQITTRQIYASALSLLEDREGALVPLQEATRIADENNRYDDQIACRIELADAYGELKRDADALSASAEAVELSDQHGTLGQQIQTRKAAASLFARLKRPEDQERRLREALARAPAAADVEEECELRVQLAKLLKSPERFPDRFAELVSLSLIEQDSQWAHEQLAQALIEAPDQRWIGAPASEEGQ